MLSVPFFIVKLIVTFFYHNMLTVIMLNVDMLTATAPFIEHVGLFYKHIKIVISDACTINIVNKCN